MMNIGQFMIYSLYAGLVDNEKLLMPLNEMRSRIGGRQRE